MNQPTCEELKELLINVSGFCNLICNSPAETPIKGEIESKAFYIGHHPYLLNPDSIEELLKQRDALQADVNRFNALMRIYTVDSDKWTKADKEIYRAVSTYADTERLIKEAIDKAITKVSK
jgi:hypothetical protein